MSEINIKHLNETHIRVECERSIATELRDHFTFYVDGHKFHPRYKARLWDGKLSLFKLGSRIIYKGLLKQVLLFCKKSGYSVTVDPELLGREDVSLDDVTDIMNNHIQYVNGHEPRDYQIAAVHQCLKYKRRIIESPTGSGKSLIQATLIKFLLSDDSLEKGKILVIVPSVHLVNQMYSDFYDYFGPEFVDGVHKIYSGREKKTDKRIIISTWQSLANVTSPEFYNSIGAVLLDECHIAAASSTELKIVIKLIEKMKNSEYRFGFTGTVKKGRGNLLTLTGLFGEVFVTSKTHELIANKTLSNLIINCLILKYPDQIKEESKHLTYQEELKTIESDEDRNDLIINLTNKLKGNTIILCSRVEQHGKPLFDRMKEEFPDRQVFFVSATVSGDIRESIRKTMEEHESAILIGSYQCLSTGINIPSLSNLIFASPLKSDSRIRQSIGRVLRARTGKDTARVFDLVDDLRISGHTNYLWTHFRERLETYADQKFDVKFKKISL